MRFFSLTAIVMLGVSFYVGVSSSSTIMADNVDAYNDRLNLKDITVYSNYGFDQDDLDAIRSLEDVASVSGTKFVDTIAYMEDSAVIARIHSYDPEDELNHFDLREGRLPVRNNELLAEAGTDLMPGPPVGASVTLTRPDDDLEDWLAESRYTVVGTIDTPLYLNETKENSTLSNRYIDTYFYVPESAFLVDYDTEVSVVYRGAKDYESFYDDYEQRSTEVKQEIELLGKTQSLHRYDEIYEDAMAQYNDGLAEYNDGLETYSREIADAEKEISDAAAEIADGWEQLHDGEQKLNDAQKELDDRIAEARSEIESGREELEDAKKKLAEGWKEYEAEKEKYKELRQQLSDGIASLKEARDGLNQIDSGIRQLEELKTQLENIKKGNIPISVLLDAYPDLREPVQAIGLPESTTVRELMGMELTDVDRINEIADAINEELGPSLDENVSVSELMDEYPELGGLLSILGLNENSSASEVLRKLTDTAVAEIPAVQEAIGQIDPDYDSLLQNLPLSYLRGQNAQLDALIDSYGLSGNNTLQDLIDRTDGQIADLRATRASIVNQLRQNGIEESGLDAAISEYESSLKQIDDGLAEGLKQLQDAEKQIKDGEAELAEGEAELERQRADAQAQIDEGRAEIEENRRKLNEAEAELADGRQELEDARMDGAQELEDAKAELDKALDDINGLENGTWTVLDREQHYASRTFRNAVETMAAIAAIFPLFFILVAGLVCLTTMTRMVDEQRGQIGIMLALGYTRLQTALKYLVYALSAGLIGSLLGSVAGLLSIPAIVYNAWRMMYILPPMKIFIPWRLIITTTVMFIAVLLGITWYTCMKDMKGMPAELMRPKAPKIGRNTVIARIPALWNRMSFTWKVTVRNLARYKKRLIMTVIGVAGCTALLLTGFGVKYSINSMVDIQFDELVHYNGIARLNSDLSVSQVRSYAAELERDEGISRAFVTAGYTAIASRPGYPDETVITQVFSQDDEVSDVYLLRTRRGHVPLVLDDTGIIISERMAENLDLSVGDTVRFEGANGMVRDVRISGICEMYIQHYAIMTENYYRSVFGTVPRKDTILITLSSKDSSDAVQRRLTQDPAVASMEFNTAVLDNFKKMVDSLDMIVGVLIISSMALAFVVLGNLTNINISERQREIATLKVLGFRPREVEEYIYKENNILIFLGSLAGIPMGRVMHRYIMGQVEMDYIMFGRALAPLHVLYSILMTIAFGLLVNRMMAGKLRRITMVESLKSVE
ncbi:MAG: ABC transporter permease [Solobacterium sp.]|nr:ABC transporter permease [Solobacterium sp.]